MKPLPTDPSAPLPHSAVEGAVRPKFSRRPASFSRTAVAEELTSEKIDATPMHAPARGKRPVLNFTPWQEDARFGIVLLVLIALVNMALVYGLPLLPQEALSSSPTQVEAKAPSMPRVTGNSGDTVTLYSQPDRERRTIYLLDLRNTASEQNALSVSPHDIPPPVARALDDEDSGQ